MKKLIAILLITALLSASALADVGDTLPNHIVMRGMAASMDLDGDGTEEALRWDMVDIDEYTSSLALTVVDAEGTQVHYLHAKKTGDQYLDRVRAIFRDPDVLEFDMKHEELLLRYPKDWAEKIAEILKVELYG